MLLQAKAFKAFKLRALDGDIGKANEFYFDDKHWTVRYLVADTGGWLIGRQVLISPYALSPVLEEEQVIPVNLTMKQIENSPSLTSHQPVSRQYELDYYAYYEWPYYGYGTHPWGAGPYIVRDPESQPEAHHPQHAWDPHLHSTHDVTGHHIHAVDGAIGHVTDFVIDEETWSIRYLIVDTNYWWAGKRILISPQWIERISWDEAMVHVTLTREDIKQAPEYLPESLTRDYETELHDHYCKPVYWADELSAKRH
jgi:hypothetical protein